MPIQIHIQFSELPIVRVLHKIESGLADTTPLMDGIGTVLAEGTERRFDTGMSPAGTPWPKSLRVKEQGGQTLVQSGRLANINHVAERDEVRVGTNAFYGRIHQLGGTIRPRKAKALTFRLPNGQMVSVGKVTIPARPYLGVDGEDRAGIEEQTRKFIEGLVK